jgi:hypothetical protein
MYTDLGEFTADYVRTIDGPLPRNREELAKEIAVAWCDGNPDMQGLDDEAFMDTAHNSIAPQVAYYLH